MHASRYCHQNRHTADFRFRCLLASQLRFERLQIGSLPDMTPDDAVSAVKLAAEAWDKGQGEWPQMPLAGRIAAVEKLVVALKEPRDT